MPPDMMTLLDQLSLVVLALVMRSLMGKYYSPPQWISFVVTSFAMLRYMSIRDAEKKKKINDGSLVELQGNLFIGISLMVPQVLISVLASVLCEKLLKDSSDKRSFWEQKAAMEVSGFVVALAHIFVINPLCLSQPAPSFPLGLVKGWDGMTLLALVFMLIKLWLAELLAKILDSVTKQLGSCVAMLVIYFELFLLPEPFGDKDMRFDYDSFVALSVVALSIGSFAITTRYTKRVVATQQKLDQIRKRARGGTQNEEG